MAKVKLEGKLTSRRPCDSGSRARRRLGVKGTAPVAHYLGALDTVSPLRPGIPA